MPPEGEVGALIVAGQSKDHTAKWMPKDGVNRAFLFADPGVEIHEDVVAFVVDVIRGDDEDDIVVSVSLVTKRGYVSSRYTQSLGDRRSAVPISGFTPGQRVLGLPTVADMDGPPRSELSLKEEKP
jgi:hypothetical protein